MHEHRAVENQWRFLTLISLEPSSLEFAGSCACGPSPGWRLGKEEQLRSWPDQFIQGASGHRASIEEPHNRSRLIHVKQLSLVHTPEPLKG
jgi:hypothetical protein